MKKIFVIAKKHNNRESLKCFFDRVFIEDNNFIVLSCKSLKYIKNNKEREKKNRVDLIIFKKKWINGFIFYDKDETVKKFYFNVAENIISRNCDLYEYIDFDLDIVASADLKEMNILDENDFKENSVKFKYSKSTIKNCMDAVQEIKKLKTDIRFKKLLNKL